MILGDHDADILEWSEAQAALLRRAAAGERVNGLDWPNIIDEVESAGSEVLNAVRSLLVQAMVHRLKVDGWPEARDAEHWRSEAERFSDEVALRFAPSMRQRIDLSDLFRRARRRIPAAIDGLAPGPLPTECPYTLDELLSDG